VPFLLSRDGVADVHSSAAAGCAHNLFIDRDGRLLRCGDDPDDDSTPRVFSSLRNVRFRSVSSNKWFTLSLALSEEGKVYSWGSFREEASAWRVHDPDVLAQEPQIVTSLNAISVRGISAGAHHCAAHTAEGALYTWAYWDDSQAASAWWKRSAGSR
jgi:regulator of chromosome condensation